MQTQRGGKNLCLQEEELPFHARSSGGELQAH